jgi:hypothetical protein
LFFTLIIIAAMGAGCFGINIGLLTAEETMSQNLDVPDDLSVIVESFNGTIEVKAGSENQVLIDAVKRGSGNSQEAAEADLENVEVSVELQGNTLTVIGRRTDNKMSGNSGVTVSLTVPVSANLDIKTSNGGISTLGNQGDIQADSSNGKITLNGALGNLNANTSNGAIEIDAEQAVVTANTNNGRIDFRGSLAAGVSSFNTSNGAITLTLPADASFTLDADTSNSNITCDFPLSDTQVMDDDQLKGTVGENPEVSITAYTSNGRIEINRAP